MTEPSLLSLAAAVVVRRVLRRHPAAVHLPRPAVRVAQRPPDLPWPPEPWPWNLPGEVDPPLFATFGAELAAVGVVDSEPNIRSKLARGKFTAVFLIQCLEAIGCHSVRLGDG